MIAAYRKRAADFRWLARWTTDERARGALSELAMEYETAFPDIRDGVQDVRGRRATATIMSPSDIGVSLAA